MPTLGITKAITNLTEAHGKLGVLPETKRYGFSVRQAIPQTLAYMVGAATSPIFALMTTGEDYLFIKCDRCDRESVDPVGHDSLCYGLSDKFTLSTAEGNQLYTVAQILKRLASI
jgi:hypothetical protein